MKFFARLLCTLLIISLFSGQVFSQSDLPKDYLTKEFRAGRREALRKLMPDSSATVLFAYPLEVFSKDINYAYHPNPDLLYFSGYKETSGVLVIFKNMQHDADGDFNELFFVQSRNPAQEQWTGRRLGIEGVKTQLGFKRVYNSDEFAKFPVDLKKFKLFHDVIPRNTGNMNDLYRAFTEKSGVTPVDEGLLKDLVFTNAMATPQNVAAAAKRFIEPKLTLEAYKNNSLIQNLYRQPDSLGLMAFRAGYQAQYGGIASFNRFTNDLRGIKTSEELELLRKSIKLSSIAHAEVMRAIKPNMSESELEGVFLYVHKKYGAEDEGYPPIVGAGANGCILHYIENEVTTVNNQLVLMDVGAEYHGYSADVTRTIPANGKFTDEQKAIYQLVFDAQEEVFKLCKAGVPFADLNKKAQSVLAAGLIKLGIIKTADEVNTYYPHGCSHHLGLDVHDKGSYKTLMENMVITVEPGLYIPEGSPCDKKWWNIAVRIEDDVVIGKDKGTILSLDAPRKWDEVEKMTREKSFLDAVNLPLLDK
ncbi:aminopeptidase P family protein [Dyadobacter arcticus]|uniref:Xaa-Pro aminopeptidase n=1 Tax=Dyadobacter arcticus TaxID=1078754 RepID=A0ABX0UN89_9BACT|nr:aminopeptidase P family protein [Dyadobacter arcticus]NIJ54458.1 Xaa-Pro aminopeptidase [Dyadobacter arcticus]